MLKKITISAKIIIGFSLISILMISMVIITIIKVNSTTTINNKVIDLRVPTAMSSIEMINGMNHSLAALRGWIILGKDKFKDERDKAWKDEITLSLDTMTTFSKNWTNPKNIERLKNITAHLKDFKRYQQEIEDIAHNIDNNPALKILFNDAAPQATMLISNITKMIDIELMQEATPKRRALLGMMADVRGTTGLALANIRAYLLSGDDKFKILFDKLWMKNTKRFNQLSTNTYLLTSKQKEEFTKFSNARKIFNPLPTRMFKIRGGKEWNIANLWLGTKAAPTAFKIKTELDAMIKDQKALMRMDIQSAKDSSQSLITLEYTLLVIGLLLSIIISISIQKTIVSSINNFQDGLLNFFQYLNREKDYVKLLDESANDEIGVMARVVNKNINQTKQGIEEDRELIKDTQIVMGRLSNGWFSQHIVANTSNPALNELKNTINNALAGLKDKFISINGLLEQYTNSNYINKLEIDDIEKNGVFDKLLDNVNTLRDAITTMLVENKQNGLTLDKSSNILLQNVDILNNNSNEAATALEETAAALEEITSIISNNTTNVSKMTEYASSVTNSANEGQKLATLTTKAMDEIDQEVNAINDAISVIDQIAFQTNILSLNAAVEAATAGESGKGFAVVAQEVRNLASRSADAANEIKLLVLNATEKANNGKEIADKMTDGYIELNENISKTINLISDVESSSKEQRLGIMQINNAVAELDKQTQKNSDIASQTHEVSIQTDSIAKIVVQSANEKEFIGKDTVTAKDM